MPLTRLEMDAIVAVGPWQIYLPTTITRGEETNSDNVEPTAHAQAVIAIIHIRVKENALTLCVSGWTVRFNPQLNSPLALQYEGVHQGLVQQEIARESAINPDAAPELSRFIVDNSLSYQRRSHFALGSL